MRRLLTILTFLPTLLHGQNMANSVGVVMLGEQYDNTDHKIELLNEDGSVWYLVDCYEPLNYNPDFRILAFKPDYFLFKIKCKRETQTHYEVVVNEETGLTKSLKKSDKIKLVNWEKYVTDVFSVDFEPTDIQVLDNIDGTPISEQPKSENLMIPKEVKGDWMRIIWTPGNYEYPSDNSNVQSGWIRWRTNNRITVTLYHLS
ncbi:hypothetical protein [Ekhidna sp.]|uniref:hypothetical protein n=1 Tax=Ekhidna sp. TaxID=2608089 RepID=UPI003C7B5139